MSSRTDILPSFYYHDHFMEMIDFVRRIYAPVLGADEHDFIAGFFALSRPAQCLFIRMVNRKRWAFHPADFRYAEIEDAEGALAELHLMNFARPVLAEDYEAVLGDLSKSAMTALAKNADLKDLKPGARKSAMAEFILNNLSFEAFCCHHDVGRHAVPRHRPAVQFLLYLYFGKAYDGLTSFALRDLGIISAASRDNYAARFQDLAEAKAGFFYQQAIQTLKLKRKRDYTRFASSLDQLPSAPSRYTEDLRNDFLGRLAGWFERSKEFDTAIEIHRLAGDGRERLVRLLHAKGETAEVKTLLEAMIADPASDEEFLFAADFFERKFKAKRLGLHTELLRQSETVFVDDLYRGSPEQAVLYHYKNLGWQGYHIENGLWPALFAIVFWDELFEHSDSFSCGFDRLPHFLSDHSFRHRFADGIARKLTEIRAGNLVEMIETAFESHQDKDNGIFFWYEDLRDILSVFVAASNGNQIAAILEKISHDFHAMRDGYPDLMLVRGHELKFIEVKAEGDQIRRNQLARLTQLRDAGFAAEICRVAYRFDPQQIYVVVDVETTGGRPPFDRVTEIGAVKIRNGEIIGEWQSLINPDRRIPAMITQLTGISNQMVEAAPRFADIADDFTAFMEGAVFAAHNVNFDYGFIVSEYQRLEVTFRFPKLCTCAAMRRHYPGHASYSLANLCREYRVGLVNHHRALCDARAAAGLLCLVNEKRRMAAGETETATTETAAA